jgi:hypothetical protein
MLMEDAGVWIKGNLSHRFRDIAVDFWQVPGCSMTEIAAMLEDIAAIVEKHYADLASKRMEERLSKIPVRPWGCCDGRDTDSVLKVYERPNSPLRILLPDPRGAQNAKYKTP